MTILAGMFSRDRDPELSEVQVDAVRRALSRGGDAAITEFRDRRAFLAKVDIGAYGDAAFRIGPSGSVMMAAGHPLLSDAAGRGRSHDLAVLHERWDADRREVLDEVNGVFCAIHYDPETARLTLLADKLGLRPLYYWIGPRYVVFATSLRLLDALPEVPRIMDLRAVTEIAHFGYPLGDRTPYRDVAVLRPAEIIEVGSSFARRQRYWRWDRAAAGHPPQEVLAAAYESFSSGVARRLGADRAAVAFLSGGLDSRCTVAALRQLGATIYTFNFAPPGTQDQVFAAQFARAAGALHEEVPLAAEVFAQPQWSSLLAAAWAASRHRYAVLPERPSLAWSGDGGSVGVGHQYLTRRVADLLRRGAVDQAIRTYFAEQGMGVSRRLLNHRLARELLAVPVLGVREELAQFDVEDPGWGFYLFLLFNEQRRHVAAHYEDIDQHRMELQLPFFDSRFLTIVQAVPLDVRLGHRWYVQWLEHFPPAVRAVPWQAYPGHVPCPLPVNPSLSYQWDRAFLREAARAERATLLAEAEQVLEAADFPGPILQRGRLRLAIWLHRLGLRDYRHVFGTARTYHHHWRRSGGRCDGVTATAPRSELTEAARSR